MKAAVLRAVAGRMGIEDLAIARPAPREVLVRLAACGVCHSDVSVHDGSMPSPLPAVLGHEAAGVVEQVGSDVTTVRPGDHVVVCLAFHCGHCDQCESGNGHRCMPGAGRTEGEPPRLVGADGAVAPFMGMGAFAEQMLVHESGCVAIDRAMPFDRACLIGCGVTTGFGAVARSAGVRPGETVAVIGCGGVGLAAINAAAVAGAARIVAIDRLPDKLALARAFGATDTVDAGAGAIAEQVRELTGGRGVDHAIEAIGLGPTIEAAYAMLAKGGTATVVGAASPATMVRIPAITLLQERRLQGSLMGGVRTHIDIPRYVDLYMRGQLKLDLLVSRTRPLAELDAAFADCAAGTVARSVIVFDA